MHVLFCTSATGRPRGGSEHLWMQTAERLANEGVQVTVAVRWLPEHRHRLDRIEHAGATVILLPAESQRATLTARIANRVGIARIEQPWDWLDRLPRPDLIVSSLCYHLDAIDVAEACTVRGWPYLNLVECAGWQGWPPDKYVPPLRAAYLGAAANCFVATANCKLVESQISESVPRSRVVHNPYFVSHTSPLPWPKEPGLRLACPARYDLASKAQDVLLEVLAQPVWRDRNITLSLFGEGENNDTLRRLIALHGVQDKVHLAGHVDSIEAVWRTHHALLLASRCEGLPLALVEAMLCGRVPIVTDTGGSGELVTDGHTGFLAAEATCALVCDALERAWVRRAEWEAIGQTAASAAREAIPADPVAEFSQVVRAVAEA